MFGHEVKERRTPRIECDDDDAIQRHIPKEYSVLIGRYPPGCRWPRSAGLKRWSGSTRTSAIAATGSSLVATAVLLSLSPRLPTECSDKLSLNPKEDPVHVRN